jgi:anti-anti-sigma factor
VEFESKGAPMVQYEVMDREDDHADLRLEGELVGPREADRLKNDLERHYVDDGVKLIRVDLSRLRFISLEGIASLLDLWRASLARGKRFVVVGARAQVREKMFVTGVLRPLERGAGSAA